VPKWYRFAAKRWCLQRRESSSNVSPDPCSIEGNPERRRMARFSSARLPAALGQVFAFAFFVQAWGQVLPFASFASTIHRC